MAVFLLTFIFCSFTIKYSYASEENIFTVPAAASSTGSGLSLDDKELFDSLSGLPIGSVIAWPYTIIPEKFLECNGQAVNGTLYPKLKSMMSKVPDYRGRFLEGNNVPGQIKDAGLPNIIGNIGMLPMAKSYDVSGAFYRTGTTNWGYYGNSNPHSIIKFDASKSNSIYGRSTTVQPPSVTVKFIIKAK